MIFKIDVTYPKKSVPKLTRKTLNDFKKAALWRVGMTWVTDMMPTHFTAEGARKYQYGRRNTKDVTSGRVKTTKTKRPRSPDGRPLVWSGDTLRATSSVSIRVTSNRCRVVFPRVKNINYIPRKNPSLRMVDEFRHVTHGELKQLGKVARDSLETRLRGLGATVGGKNKVTIRTGV